MSFHAAQWDPRIRSGRQAHRGGRHRRHRGPLHRPADRIGGLGHRLRARAAPGCHRVAVAHHPRQALAAPPHPTGRWRVRPALVGSAIERMTPSASAPAMASTTASTPSSTAPGSRSPIGSRRTLVGAGGLTIRQAWHDGMEPYLGVAVHGFPNYFLITGPDTRRAGALHRRVRASSWSAPTAPASRCAAAASRCSTSAPTCDPPSLTGGVGVRPDIRRAPRRCRPTTARRR